MNKNWSDIFGNDVSAVDLAKLPFLADYLRSVYEELCDNPNSGYEIGRYTWEDFQQFASQINRDAAQILANKE